MTYSGFNGLVALVTGGASGIGLATSARLAECGAQVAVLDLSSSGIPDDVLALEGDVTDSASIDTAVARIVDEFGGLDIVINSAGIGAQGSVVDNDAAEWHHVLDVNVVGIARVLRAAIPYLKLSSAAAIVNVCSVVANVGLPSRALYSASKGAVLALTYAMAADHIREGIRVNCVNPGTADTPWISRLLEASGDPEGERIALEARQPMGRLVTPAEVAEAIVHLASPAAGATTGTSVLVDGGLANLRLPSSPAN